MGNFKYTQTDGRENIHLRSSPYCKICLSRSKEIFHKMGPESSGTPCITAIRATHSFLELTGLKKVNQARDGYVIMIDSHDIHVCTELYLKSTNIIILLNTNNLYNKILYFVVKLKQLCDKYKNIINTDSLSTTVETGWFQYVARPGGGERVPGDGCRGGFLVYRHPAPDGTRNPLPAQRRRLRRRRGALRQYSTLLFSHLHLISFSNILFQITNLIKVEESYKRYQKLTRVSSVIIKFVSVSQPCEIEQHSKEIEFYPLNGTDSDNLIVLRENQLHERGDSLGHQFQIRVSKCTIRHQPETFDTTFV